MNDKARALQERTHRFFIRVTEFCERLPRGVTTDSIVPQLIDAAGSTNSNYRAACRARSTKEFIAKIGVAAEEADESLGWLRSLLARRFGDESECGALIQEANELTAILTKSQKTARKRLEDRNSQTRSR